MSINEAYDVVLKALDDLESDGIQVDRTSVSAAGVSDDGDLPREKWLHIGIHTDDLDMIFSVENALWRQGISFNTGYGFGIRDWELDWSFTAKQDDLTKSVKEMRMDCAKNILK